MFCSYGWWQFFLLRNDEQNLQRVWGFLFAFLWGFGVTVVLKFPLILQWDSQNKSAGEKYKHTQFYQQYFMCWLRNMKSFCINFSCKFPHCGTYHGHRNVIYFPKEQEAVHQLLKSRLLCMWRGSEQKIQCNPTLIDKWS